MPEGSRAYEPRRFRSAAPYYARYRLHYPRELIERIVQFAGLEAGDRVLDLGSGPGLLAIPFAEAGMQVTAVDPEPDMLTIAREGAQAAGVEIEVRQGSSYDLPHDMGPFRLVTIGRAFHWMDREQTLRDLDQLVASEGAIALFEDDHPKTVENAWRKALRDVRDRFGHNESAHMKEAADPTYRSHESILLSSPFSRLERVSVIIRRETNADDIVGLAFSLSTTSPEKLGEKTEAFERDLRDELKELSPDGRFTEIAEQRGLIARRPD